MRVHIGYKPVMEADHEPSDGELEEVGRLLGVENIKLRLRVLSGDIAPDQLEKLRAREGVAWVEVDRTRFAR